MSCAGKGYGTNPRSNDFLYAQFYTSIVTTSVRPKTTRNCRKSNPSYPSFTPVLYSLSVTSSPSGSYSLVYVNGYNFLPNGTTFIKFGNYAYGYLPVTYYSSFNLSFVVPLNAGVDNYQVQVVNLYNGNFSTEINQSYPGNLNFSNSITYTIT
jgi:hypothetical protein